MDGEGVERVAGSVGFMVVAARGRRRLLEEGEEFGAEEAALGGEVAVDKFGVRERWEVKPCHEQS